MIIVCSAPQSPGSAVQMTRMRAASCSISARLVADRLGEPRDDCGGPAIAQEVGGLEIAETERKSGRSATRQEQAT